MKIKPLVWKKVSDTCWFARSPAFFKGGTSVFFEEGEFWATWDAAIPGSDTLEPLQAKAQEIHDAYVMQFLEDV